VVAHCITCTHTWQVCFVAALSDFDVPADPAEPEGSLNTPTKLDLAVESFRPVAAHFDPAECACILLLNKKDLFEAKLRTKCYADFDPSYTGDNEPHEVARHIAQRFIEANKASHSNWVFHHLLCATDHACMKQIWRAIAAIILDAQIYGGLL